MFSENQKDSKANEYSLIMVVEDSRDQALYLEQILLLNDYRVVCVRDAQKALDMIVGGLIPSALIIDIHLPTMNGFDLMKKMQQMKIEIPTIITSGTKTDLNFEKAFVLGAEDYFVKPFSSIHLLSSLHKVLMSKVSC